MRLSAHFRLEEFRTSRRFPELAARMEFSEWDRHKCFLLARTILEPVRETVGRPVVITSGKRSAELNRAVGGAAGSDHLFIGFSAAVDFTTTAANRDQLVRAVERIPGFSFGQLIVYFETDGRRPRFVHASLPTIHHQGERLIHAAGMYRQA